MADPLQEVLAAESAARVRVEETREKLESELRAARIDANRIKERNEQRTRAAVERAERRCAEVTRRELDRLEDEFSRQLSIDDPAMTARLERLAEQYVDQLWPD